MGDFSKLAKDYTHRTGYSLRVIKALACYIGALRDDFLVADVGAGTGKLTENLSEIGLSGYAIEPNDSMREEGIRIFKHNSNFRWQKGSAENTGLADSSVDWVFMASSFHWTDAELALKEFHRILTPGGFFSALWNPRNLDDNPLHQRIESKIHDIVPNLRRRSSGSAKYTKGIEDKLMSAGYFHNIIFMEAPHEVVMSKERYLGAWRSVNDIQAQAGEAKFQQIMQAIEDEISEMEYIIVPYKTRAWTVQSTKGD